MADIQNQDNINNQSSWELVKKARIQAKLERQKQAEEEKRKIEERRRQKKIDKTELKAKIKEINLNKKNAHIEYKKVLKGAKAHHKQDKKKRLERIEEIKKDWRIKKIDFSDEKRELKFNFGKKYRTVVWGTTKWLYGIRKEFNRIVWSSPKNTFKYLGIIIVIVGIISALFFIITLILVAAGIVKTA